MPKESLASQDGEDREKTSFHANASVLTQAVHACLFLCVKERIREYGSVCVRGREREADSNQYSGRRAEVTWRAFTFH